MDKHDLIKESYFQGTEKPAPKKKKYKSEKAIVVQPRFTLFKNYDLYDAEGVDGPVKDSPGPGFYSHIDEYKNVTDFRNKKQKANKNKYKSDDSYKEDDGSITKSQKKSNKIARRMMLLSVFIKNAIDFPIDDQIGSDPILGDSGAYGDSVPIGGMFDQSITTPDFEGKGPQQLNYGRDYTEDAKSDNSDLIKFLLDESGMLNPKETDLYGLPDGISPPEDLENINNTNPGYGTTDSGNTLYDKISY